MSAGLIFVAVLIAIGYYGAVVQPRRKKARTESSLEPLSYVVSGVVSDERLRGTYHGYDVEAWPKREYPGPRPRGTDVSVPTPPAVNIFQIRLSEVPGARSWRCESYPRPPASLIPDYFPRLTNRLMSPRFRFPRHVGLVKSTPLDPALQERLRDAGLFDALSQLRWGSSPYLPKARVTLRTQTIADQAAAAEARYAQGLRASGHGEYEALMRNTLHERVQEIKDQNPDALELEVEMGRHTRIPTPEAFQRLLDRAIGIAQINSQVNAPG